MTTDRRCRYLLPGPQVVEVVALDLIDVEDGVGPHDEEAVLGLLAVLSVRSVLVTGLQKTIWVPHLPEGTWDGRGMTLPPRFFHWLNVAHHFEVRPCRADASSKRSGLIPRYAFVLTTLAGEPALGPTRQGRRQGGTPPDSRAAMIWSVMDCTKLAAGWPCSPPGRSWLVINDRTGGVGGPSESPRQAGSRY